MKKLLFILSVILCGCPSNKGSHEIEEGKVVYASWNRDTITEIREEKVVGHKSSKVSDFMDDTVFSYKGIRIYPILFHIEDEAEYRWAIMQESKGKTDTLHTQFYIAESIHFDFKDYNFDGHPDLNIWRMDLYAIGHLFLYNNKTQSYKTVKDYEDYAESWVLDSSMKLRYSYMAAGCGDMAWTSYLFTVRNNKVIRYGSLYFDACVDSPYYELELNQGEKIHKKMNFKKRGRIRYI